MRGLKALMSYTFSFLSMPDVTMYLPKKETITTECSLVDTVETAVHCSQQKIYCGSYSAYKSLYHLWNNSELVHFLPPTVLPGGR